MKGIEIFNNYCLNFSDRYLHFKYLIHKKKINVIGILLESISFH